MRSRLFAASAAVVTVVLLGVSADPSNAQTPSTVIVGVVTVTSPPVVAPPPAPTPQVSGTRRTVSCRTYYRGHGKRRHVTKRVCRKRRVSAVPTRRSVQSVSVPQPPLVVPQQPSFVVPPPATFVVASPPPPPPPPPTFVIAPPPPVIIVNVAVAPVVKKVDRDAHDSPSAKREKKSKSDGEGKSRGKSKGKSKGRDHDED